jgi:hypothetical protein
VSSRCLESLSYIKNSCALRRYNVYYEVNVDWESSSTPIKSRFFPFLEDNLVCSFHPSIHLNAIQKPLQSPHTYDPSAHQYHCSVLTIHRAGSFEVVPRHARRSHYSKTYMSTILTCSSTSTVFSSLHPYHPTKRASSYLVRRQASHRLHHGLSPYPKRAWTPPRD